MCKGFRGGLSEGILLLLFAVRPLGCSWGVRGRQFRPFPADVVVCFCLGGSGPELKNKIDVYIYIYKIYIYMYIMFFCSFQKAAAFWCVRLFGPMGPVDGLIRG